MVFDGGDPLFPLNLIVLAGGSSRRMQADKALLPVQRGTLIEYVLGQLEGRFVETLISVTEPFKYLFLERKLVVDEKAGCGPMMGIKTALAASKTEKNFVIACDIPVVDFDLLESLIRVGKKAAIVVPVTPRGKAEPLFAVYSKSVLPEMQKLLDKGVRSLLPLLDRCRTQTVLMGTDSLINLNTIDDFNDFIRRL